MNGLGSPTIGVQCKYTNFSGLNDGMRPKIISMINREAARLIGKDTSGTDETGGIIGRVGTVYFYSS